MDLSQIISITTSLQGASVTKAGFGIPLWLSTSTPTGPAWVERVRTYRKASDVAADFATTTHEYLAAARYFAQNPNPGTFLLGRLVNKPTMIWTVPVAAVNDSTDYTLSVAGQSFTHPSGTGATNDSITDGLATLITAASITGVTVTTPGTTGNHLLTITMTAGLFVEVTIARLDLLKLVQTTADVSGGIAAELTAILNENNTWYVIGNSFNSAALASAIDTWAASNKKKFIFDSADSTLATLALSSGSDIGQTLKTAASTASMWLYHPQASKFAAAGWMGAGLSFDAGSETWAYLTLEGVPAVTLTPTQETNILAKNGNLYTSLGGLNKTFEGKVPSGTYFDLLRGLDALVADIRENVVTFLANAKPKVGYDDRGIAGVQGVVEGSAATFEQRRYLAAGWRTAVPKAAAVATQDKTDRILRNVELIGNYVGAIHKGAFSITLSA